MVVIYALMRHILSWSGGKDSTASVILAHLHGEPLDEIIYCEPMYDLEKGISAELPQQERFVQKAKRIFEEEFGYKVTILRSDRDYQWCFHHMIDSSRCKIEEHRGKRYGFPVAGRCGMQREAKLRPINGYIRSLGPVIQYIGIAVDEPKRLVSMHRSERHISLLEKYGYTEQMCYELCEKYGLLAPMYEIFGVSQKRNGCWFCPWAKPIEQAAFAIEKPRVWEEFVSLERKFADDVAYGRWNCFQPLAMRDFEVKEIVRELKKRGVSK